MLPANDLMYLHSGEEKYPCDAKKFPLHSGHVILTPQLKVKSMNR